MSFFFQDETNVKYIISKCDNKLRYLCWTLNKLLAINMMMLNMIGAAFLDKYHVSVTLVMQGVFKHFITPRGQKYL